MKKSILIVLLIALAMSSPAQEFKVVTIVESIVPMGMGRSRIVEPKEKVDVKAFTTDRTDGKKSKQKEVKRETTKIKNFSETKLLNFYSGVGINFRNIASNDAIISAKINDMIKEGWELVFVNGGVESAGNKDPNGIYITRLFFKKNKSSANK